MPTCPTCQSPLLDNTRFCMNCGAAVGEAAPTAAPTPTIGIVAPASATTDMQSSRTRSRTIAIAGLLLCLFFFSPFVSCGAQTWTGMEAFQESLPNRYEEPKDGIFLILLPIAGLAGIAVGAAAMKRIEAGQPLAALRTFGVVALLMTLLAACPLSIALIDVSRSQGNFELQWGFWASVLAAGAMLWGGLGLLGANTRSRPGG